MAYCTYTDFRTISPMSTADIADTEVTSLIALATAKLNSDINIRVDISPEEVFSIDYERQNIKNGTNTTFYTRNYPLGDYNNDGALSTSDLDVFKISSSGVRSDLTVSTLNDYKIGKFTLSVAPDSSDRLFVRYSIAPLDESTPHPLIKQACLQLVASMASTKVGTDAFNSISLGRLRVGKSQYNNDIHINRYNELVSQIVELVRKATGYSLFKGIQNESIEPVNFNR